MNEGLALEILVAFVAVMLAFLLRKAFHELVHQLGWIRVAFGFLAPSATTSSVVTALLGRLS